MKARVGSRLQPQHDDARFEQMYTSHRDAVWFYVVRRVGRDDVDDAVAEVFMVAWRKMTHFPNPDEQLPWLYGIGKNVVRNTKRSAHRRQRLWKRVSVMPPTDTPGSNVQVIRNAEDAQLLAAVERLRPIDQELLRLRRWEELPIKDIGVVVGMSPKSVESQSVRIRKNLARMLAVPASPLHVVSPHYPIEGGEQ